MSMVEAVEAEPWFTDEEGFVCQLADDGSVVRVTEEGRPIRLLQGDELNKFLREVFKHERNV